MTSYKLFIVTSKGKIFDDTIESLIAPGSEGDLGVLANHAPMVAALKNGVVWLKQNSTQKYFAVSNGILEVNKGNNVLLLTDNALEAPNLEEARQKISSFT